MVTNTGFNALCSRSSRAARHLIFVFATTEPEGAADDPFAHPPLSRSGYLAPPVRGLLENICAKEHVRRRTRRLSAGDPYRRGRRVGIAVVLDQLPNQGRAGTA